MDTLFSTERGDGKPVLLLHGFPMHQEVWKDFGARLTTTHRIITPDLPGFGKSPILPTPFSLDLVADRLLDFMKGHSLHDCVVIGHSLGGYVALCMISKRPDLFSGLGLFHSTAFADNAEKKESRTKVAAFVEKNGAMPFTTNFVAPLFADPKDENIENVKKIAGQSSAEAVIGYTLAMRDRDDHTKTLKSFKKPTLFLAGKEDPGIPVDSVFKQASLCQDPEIHILQNVAHMGMFEAPALAATKIEGFFGKI